MPILDVERDKGRILTQLLDSDRYADAGTFTYIDRWDK